MAMVGGAGAGAGALPSDDVLCDIFSRLPDTVDLLRCAATCRQWLRLLRDPAFLSRWANGRRGRGSFILGTFSQSVVLVKPTEQPTKRNQSLWPPHFRRISALPPRDRSGASDPSLFFSDDGGLFDYAHPLASRHGLLLLRIKPAPLDPRELHLAVCHPLIGARSTRLVPPPPLNVDPKSGGDDVVGYALVTAADHRDDYDRNHQRHPAFQVLLTAAKQLRAYSYSSATGRWSAPIDCPQLVSELTMSVPRAGTVASGTVHWLYRDATSYYSLDIATDSPESEHAGVSSLLTKIPVVHDGQVRLCTVGGKLASVSRSGIGKLDLWMQQEQSSDDHHHPRGWLSYELLCMPPGVTSITMLDFLQSKGAMLIQIDRGLFALHLDSKKLDYCGLITGYAQKLCTQFNCLGRNSCADCTYNKRLIYEMDWPSYLLHLYGPKEVQVQQASQGIHACM